MEDERPAQGGGQLRQIFARAPPDAAHEIVGAAGDPGGVEGAHDRLGHVFDEHEGQRVVPPVPAEAVLGAVEGAQTRVEGPGARPHDQPGPEDHELRGTGGGELGEP